MSETVSNQDPFDYLLNAGSDPGTWTLLAGPVALVLIMAAVAAVYIMFKRRKEASDLSQAISDESQSEEKAPQIKTELSDVDEIRALTETGWLERLMAGLAKTRTNLRSSLETIFKGSSALNDELLDQLHEALYRADIGAKTTEKLVAHVKESLGKNETADWEKIRKLLQEKIFSLLQGGVRPIAYPESGTPWVVLVVGVNGVGKTTTIGKLSAHGLAHGKKVLLGAADTFRAAAIEQLSVWGDRVGATVIKHQAGADPAAVAYDAVKAAIARQADWLFIDTAGRLHAKQELMAELGKINRVIGRDLPGAPHETWLVIDATTGQNALQQVKAFNEVTKLTGIVVTKLDGTAKGGMLLGIVDQFGLPIRYIGVGEKAADLREFDAREYTESLL